MDKKYCPYCMNPVKEGETCTNCGLTEGVYTPRDHHLPLGSVLNERYLIGRVLGEGGFGITYIGCDLNLEMKVAIKEYFPIDRVYRFSKASLDVSNYAHAAEKFHTGKVKFLREARTMARLDKLQNIVSVKDFFEKNNTAYIVMEYVEGTTLKELVNQRGGRIPAGELMYMLEPLFPALTSVHDMGLIHRDISPDNLMLENGKIKLLDFGCARESTSQSETMTIALKQGYAPIEQYQHKGQGPWTDVYALAATIYYCLTGKTPQSAVDRLNEEELVPPRRLGVELTADQEAALLKGMNVRAKDRFQSVEELFAALYTNVMIAPAPSKPATVPIQAKSGQEKTVQMESVLAEILPSESTSAVSASGVASGVEERMQNDVPDNGDTPNPVKASTSPETGRDQKQSVKDRIIAALNAFKKQLKNRNPVVIMSCSAVLLAAVIFVVWIVIPSKSDTELPVNAGVPGTSTISPQPETKDDPIKETETPVDELETVETLFANAVTLHELSLDSLQMLMDDETVPAIRIAEGADAGGVYGAITITKPVLIEENATFYLCDSITVQGENACLWVEGKVSSGCFLRTADGGRVVAESHECIWADTYWLERKEDVRILNGEKNDYIHLIVGGRDTLFKNAVEVRDEASLRQAIDSNQAVIICEDMTITEELQVHVAMLIEEGVTVSFQDAIALWRGGILWNEGKIQSDYFYSYETHSGSGIINYGEIINTSFLQVDTILVNMGELNIHQFCVNGDDQRGRVCNTGILRLPGSGGNYCVSLINSGTVVCATDGWLDFMAGSAGTEIIDSVEIMNYGEFRMEKGITGINVYFKNMSDGRLVLCDNATLENRGVIEMYSGEIVCEPNGILNNRDGAFYYHFFTPNDYVKDGWIHYSNVINPLNLTGVCEVSDADALRDALQDPEMEKICVTGTVSWDVKEPLTLTKEIEIYGNAELIMTEGSELILDGCYLQNSGYLKVDNLTLTHGSSLRNFYGKIEMYTPESIIKLGNAQGERNYNGTDCLMNEMGEILHYGEVTLYNNALMIQKGYLAETSLRILGHGYFFNTGTLQWGDEGIIDVSKRGQFHNMASLDWFQNLSISIGKDSIFYDFGGLILEKGSLNVASGGQFIARGPYITFKNDFSVNNNGQIHFSIGGDNSLLQGYLENYGYIYLDGPTGLVINAPVGAENPAWLNNQGEVYVWPEEGYIRILNGEFTGNEVIISRY